MEGCVRWENANGNPHLIQVPSFALPQHGSDNPYVNSGPGFTKYLSRDYAAPATSFIHSRDIC